MAKQKAYALELDSDEFLTKVMDGKWERDWFNMVRELEGFIGIHASGAVYYMLFRTPKYAKEAIPLIKERVKWCRKMPMPCYYDDEIGGNYGLKN